MSVGDSVKLGDELHVRAALEIMMTFRSLPLGVGMCKLLSFIGLKGTIQPLVGGRGKKDVGNATYSSQRCLDVFVRVSRERYTEKIDPRRRPDHLYLQA